LAIYAAQGGGLLILVVVAQHINDSWTNKRSFNAAIFFSLSCEKNNMPVAFDV